MVIPKVRSMSQTSFVITFTDFSATNADHRGRNLKRSPSVSCHICCATSSAAEEAEAVGVGAVCAGRRQCAGRRAAGAGSRRGGRRTEGAHAKARLLGEGEAKGVEVAELRVVAQLAAQRVEAAAQLLERVAAEDGEAVHPLLPREDAHRRRLHLPRDHEHDHVGRVDLQLLAELLHSLYLDTVIVVFELVEERRDLLLVDLRHERAPAVGKVRVDRRLEVPVEPLEQVGRHALGGAGEGGELLDLLLLHASRRGGHGQRQRRGGAATRKGGAAAVGTAASDFDGFAAFANLGHLSSRQNNDLIRPPGLTLSRTEGSI